MPVSHKPSVLAGLLFLLLMPCLHALAHHPAPFRPRNNPVPITRFSFQLLYGGVIVLKAAIDNYPDSLNFILDTGSGGISLDSASIEKLGIPSVPSGRTIRGIAGIKQVNFAYNHSLRLPGLQVDSLDFHINDYELLSGVYGLKVDGIIGYSFLKKFIVAIDFDKHTISIYRPGRFSYPRGGYTLKPAISAIPMQHAVVTDENEVAARYFIDTGAGLCLLMSRQFVKDSSIIYDHRPQFASVAEGIGGKKEMYVTWVKKFRLGRYIFKKMPVYVFDDEFNVTSYPFLGGLIGNDLLRRFNMVINYSQGEIHLLPNHSFRDPFDYAYTGFNMFQDGPDVLVVDVMPGSPAEKAGLKNGDIIVGVGTKFAGGLQEYKNVLQQPGNRVKLVITRDGILREIRLNVASIIKKNQD